MDHNPECVVEGLEEIIERDLEKHQGYLTHAHEEVNAYTAAAEHEQKKLAHYHSLIGKGKFNDVALQRSIKDIAINVRHMRDKTKLAKDRIEHEQLIVDTLTQQLSDQCDGLKHLARSREQERANGSSD